MRAAELFPYWADNRALLVELVRPLREDDLTFRPAPGLSTLGAMLRHVITTEEHWWHGGILGEPYARWRPEGWERFSDEEKEAYRRARFPTVASIVQGLEAAHAPVQQFLGELDAADLCEKRLATWGKQNTLRWILWHLVEHDQHHRAQVYTRLRLLGRQPSPIFPRPGVTAWTPAADWRGGEEVTDHIVPFWDAARATLREAVAGLDDTDLAFRPADHLPSIHDLILHLFIWEDFLVRQILRGEVARSWGRIEGWFWRYDVASLAAAAGDRFRTVAALLEGLDAVWEATRDFVRSLVPVNLTRIHQTPWGSQTLHHALWYAREHLVHHRAQIFLRMRMIGKVPPEV